jgi:cytochrome c oxidase subunit 4
MSDHDHAPKNLAPAKAHIVSVPTLMVVWVVLCCGAVLNLLLNSVALGGSHVLIQLVIASVMATISALYFMHLRYDNLFNMVTMILAFLFVTLFITWSSMDVVNYRDQLNSGEAQAMISAYHAQSASHGSGGHAAAPAKAK